ncbi:hypothetical protein JG688_00002206, partial [Phytophthora aleatoria]
YHGGATATTSTATQGAKRSAALCCIATETLSSPPINRLVFIYRRFNDARQDSACGRIRVRSCGKPATASGEYARWACCVVNMRARGNPSARCDGQRRNAVDFLLARSASNGRRTDKAADRPGGLPSTID